MNKSVMNLEDFWMRCTLPIFNAETGEAIKSKTMLENRNLEVEHFGAHYGEGFKIDGIQVYLEKDEG